MNSQCGATPLSALPCQDEPFPENDIPTCGRRCVTHTCHNKETCPPCYAIVQRTCVGGHNTRTAYCYEDKITCNVMCEKPLPCGHKCQEKCHDGICKEECKQPCLIKCKNGSHQCDATCHYPHKCQKTSCKETVTLKCKCSNKEQKALCCLVQGHGKPLECGTGCTAQVKRRRDPGVDFEDWVIAQLESFIEKAQKGQIPPEYKFEPTTSYNRRIIHTQATAHGCTSESFGVEPNRYTMVSVTSSGCLDEEFHEDYDCYDPDVAEENVAHPLLEREFELVQAMYGQNALKTRVYGGIDEIDIFINIDLNTFLDEHMPSAWGVNESQPLVILLHILSISNYLEGLEPKVTVFQVKDDVAPTASAYDGSTKRRKIGICSQLEKILQTFVSKQWRKISLSTVDRAMSGETPSSKTPGTCHTVDQREDAKLAKLVEIGFRGRGRPGRPSTNAGEMWRVHVRPLRPRSLERIIRWTRGRMLSWPSWWRWGSGQRRPVRPSTNAGEMWRLHVSSWSPLLLDRSHLVVGVASSPLLSVFCRDIHDKTQWEPSWK
ncbi:Transcriptional repressor NF-X1 [Geodia barretti]|uniref:Transcriptional repressor NF-X1 n=1 Tax=Geodia barretti TaxID=519541 RepID=A0AA35TRY4_GEOBA|nr:Transcriptional repressor NF-X1 [Geodia barretti]